MERKNEMERNSEISSMNVSNEMKQVKRDSFDRNNPTCSYGVSYPSAVVVSPCCWVIRGTE